MELLGLAEVAELFGVTKQVIGNWKSRRENFPAPIAELRSGPVWSKDHLLAWAHSEGIDLQGDTDKQQRRTKHRAIIIALMNMKGGVGKTTLAANLGWACAWFRNLRVLLVDLDPQFNLTQYVVGQDAYEKLVEAQSPTISEMFSDSLETVPAKELIHSVKNWRDGSCLHIIPASLELAWAMRHAAHRPHVLRDNLADIRSDYNIIIIDCAPTESALTTAAYLAADFIFIPVRPEFLSTIGLPLLMRSIKDFERNYKNEEPPQIGGIIFNDIADKIEHGRSRRFVRDVAKDHTWYVFNNAISHSESYPKGARYGQPIFLTDYARDDKKSELSRVTNELLERIGL
jgi:chromosome partitioning protein